MGESYPSMYPEGSMPPRKERSALQSDHDKNLNKIKVLHDAIDHASQQSESTDDPVEEQGLDEAREHLRFDIDEKKFEDRVILSKLETANRIATRLKNEKRSK